MKPLEIDNLDGLTERIRHYLVRRLSLLGAGLLVLNCILLAILLEYLPVANAVILVAALFVLQVTLVLLSQLPGIRLIQKSTNHFIEEINQANHMVSELAGLYEALDKSHKTVSQVNFALDRATVYARLSPEGNVVQADQKFADLLGKPVDRIHGPLVHNFNECNLPEDFMSKIAELTALGQIWRGEICGRSPLKAQYWLDATIVPVMIEGEVQSLLFNCLDITERKQFQDQLHLKSREKFEQRIKEQKVRSILILEGQEEERRRIAMDIHDGIGQILTGLKFKIESIDPEQVGKAIVRLAEARILLQELIKEVRRVTFDLTPNTLTDYGLSAALKNYAGEIERMSDTKVIYTDKTNLQKPLEKNVETNMFRIVQEAVNNALKYAAASKILITLSDNGFYLNITVEDNGQGFEVGEISTNEVFMHSGNGLLNMKARTSLHNGRFHISSKPGEGTRVNINIPLKG